MKEILVDPIKPAIPIDKNNSEDQSLTLDCLNKCIFKEMIIANLKKVSNKFTSQNINLKHYRRKTESIMLQNLVSISSSNSHRTCNLDFMVDEIPYKNNNTNDLNNAIEEMYYDIERKNKNFTTMETD